MGRRTVAVLLAARGLEPNRVCGAAEAQRRGRLAMAAVSAGLVLLPAHHTEVGQCVVAMVVVARNEFSCATQLAESWCCCLACYCFNCCAPSAS